MSVCPCGNTISAALAELGSVACEECRVDPDRFAQAIQVAAQSGSEAPGLACPNCAQRLLQSPVERRVWSCVRCEITVVFKRGVPPGWTSVGEASTGAHFGYEPGERPVYRPCGNGCGEIVRADRLDLVREHDERCPRREW